MVESIQADNCDYIDCDETDKSKHTIGSSHWNRKKLNISNHFYSIPLEIEILEHIFECQELHPDTDANIKIIQMDLETFRLTYFLVYLFGESLYLSHHTQCNAVCQQWWYCIFCVILSTRTRLYLCSYRCCYTWIAIAAN